MGKPTRAAVILPFGALTQSLCRALRTLHATSVFTFTVVLTLALVNAE